MGKMLNWLVQTQSNLIWNYQTPVGLKFKTKYKIEKADG